MSKSLAQAAQLQVDELYCLALIYSTHPSCVKDLSTLLGTRGPRTSKLLGTLERKGYLKRALSAIDHRREEVALTERGQAMVNDLLERSEEILGGYLSPEEREQLRRLVHSMGEVRLSLEMGLETEGFTAEAQRRREVE